MTLSTKINDHWTIKNWCNFPFCFFLKINLLSPKISSFTDRYRIGVASLLRVPLLVTDLWQWNAEIPTSVPGPQVMLRFRGTRGRLWRCWGFWVPRGFWRIGSSAMADSLSVIPTSVIRNLSDKLYEKRKNAALEVFLLILAAGTLIVVLQWAPCSDPQLSDHCVLLFVDWEDCEAVRCRWWSRQGYRWDQFSR